MSQWGNTDVASNSVLWGVVTTNKVANSTTRAAFYQNSTVGAWTNNGVPAKSAVGQFGASVSEVANTSGEGKKVAHAGWVVRTAFTGPVVSIAVSAGGTNYKNTDVISVNTGGLGGQTVNATAVPVTNATGGIVSVVVTNGGSGYISTSLANSSFAIANSTGGATTGSGATLTATVGGRAGRVQYETIAAFGMANSGTLDDTLLPQ